MKVSSSVPDPEEKVASLPVPKVKVGVPVTSTASERVTVIVIVSSALYDPSAVVAVTLVIVGEVVSRTNALLAAREPAAAGVARVRVALFKAVSLRVPDSELVAL